MNEIWKIAITLAGLGAIASFVLWSLYKQWLSLPIFQTLSQRNQFTLFVRFFVLTFVFGLAALGAYTYVEVRRTPDAEDVQKRDSADALVGIHPEFARGYVHSVLGEPQLVESGCDGFEHEAYVFGKAFALLTFSPENKLSAISVLVRDARWRPHLDWLQDCLSCSSFATAAEFSPDFFNSSSKEWFYSESCMDSRYGQNITYFLYYNQFGIDTFSVLPGCDIYLALESGEPFPPCLERIRSESRPNGFAEVSVEAGECGSLIYMDYVLWQKLV